jgi:hypothetical protein
MPRYDISPSARCQAETNPDKFLGAEEDALMKGLETLFPSMPIALVVEMAERHKEVHALFERRERADTIMKRAYRARRGPISEEVARLIREAEAHGDPGLLSTLYQWQLLLRE